MVRVRYAPSPTGTLHIGGARTALFNYLYARRHGGRFVLRVEDTDAARTLPGSEAAMMAGLKRLGIEWDEGPDVGGDWGPYRQSERLHRHRQAADELAARGLAYRCYCTAEELEAERSLRRARGLPPRYSGKCRARRADDPIHREGRPSVLRLKVPTEGVTVVHDLIRGQVTFDNVTLDDFVITKPDGHPVYNFAVVVDDHDMAISHVIRGEEHLSNTPKQILVYQALGYDVPQFAHLPMILAPDRSKLSKRHGATAVEEYFAQGILPEALVNYLLLLGWSPTGGDELMDLSEAAQAFDLDRVQHTAAVYDQKKLEWMNGQYLRILPASAVAEAVRPFLAEVGIVSPDSGPSLLDGVTLVRERARTLQDLAEGMRFLYRPPDAYDAKGAAKHFGSEAVAERLDRLAGELERVSGWNHDALAEVFDREAAHWAVKRAELIHPVRLAVTGTTVGPGLFELLELLGPEQTVARLARAAELIRLGALPVREPV